MVKQDLLILRLSTRNKHVSRDFWPDFSLKTAGMLINQPEIGESLHTFEGGDVEIIRVVQQGIDLARGKIEEIEEIDSDDEDPKAAPPPLKEMIMCWVIEENCMVVCTEGALEVVQSLRRYRGHLWRMSTEGAEQTTLDAFFSLKSN